MIKKVMMIVCMFIASCQNQAPSGEDLYQYYKIEKKDLVQTIEINGSVTIENESQITAPLGGRLDKLYIREGQLVTKGQKIGYMSSNERIRILDMAAHKGPTEVEYWRKQILPTYIFAPLSGKVIDLRLKEGEMVNGYIAKVSKGFIVEADVDEIDEPKVSLGQKAYMTFDISTGQKLIGEVTRISQVSKSVNNVNVYPVEISLPTGEDLKGIKPKVGMSVTVNFPVQEIGDASCIAPIAVNNQSDGTFNVELKNGETRKVILGSLFDDCVHVKEGLNENDQVRVKKFRQNSSKKKKSALNLLGK